MSGMPKKLPPVSQRYIMGKAGECIRVGNVSRDETPYKSNKMDPQ